VTWILFFFSRSWTKTSRPPLPPGARSAASETKATIRPSALIAGNVLAPLAWLPSLATLTRSVTPRSTSRTKTSELSFVSPGTRVVANDAKAT